MQQAARAGGASRSSRMLTGLVIGVFFIWGGVTSLNDVLIPKLKGLYSLTYAEVMLTQFTFFTAYFIVSIPAGAFVARIGYLRGVVAGLGVTAVGALLFWPAAASGLYWSFLVALFVLAAGITVLQVAANPFIALLGDERSSSSRLTFAQAFNSLGTTVWPYIGSNLILRSVVGQASPPAGGPALSLFRVGESRVIADVYVVIAIVLAAIALVFWARRNTVETQEAGAAGFVESVALLKRRRVALGVIALFAYVGAEVSIGSMMVNYLSQPSTMGLDPRVAGERLSLYWGGAMIGRFIGSALLQRVEPGRLLTVFAGCAGALVLASILTHGSIAGWSLLAVGLFNSIMFPTIFSLALQGLGAKSAEGSGLLCMAIVGGAVVPLATGAMADVTGIAAALAIPLACYAVIAAFGVAEPSEG